MTNAKHTQGPWKEHLIGANPAYEYQRKYEGWWEINLPGFGGLTPIALIPAVHNAATFNEKEANARLIAAAPELLEALKWCVLELERRGGADENDYAPPEFRKARAAIAKVSA